MFLYLEIVHVTVDLMLLVINFLIFFRKTNIYIVNGRVGKDKLRGDCTCQDVSLIDYFLASSKVFPYISDFEVNDFSPLFSDVHKHLHITLRIREPDASPIHTEQNNEPRIQARRWSEEKSGDFC